MFKSFLHLSKAISNEIAIDKDVMKRINAETLPFTPLRPLKSLHYLRKIPGKTVFYLFLNASFLFLSPVLFGLQLFSTIKYKYHLDKPSSFDTNANIILQSNNRTLSLFKNNILSDNNYYLIKFDKSLDCENCLHILQFISTPQILKCYFEAVIYVIKNIPMINNFNLLQCYVAFDWFVKYYALKAIPFQDNQDVYFSNHYDRWAVMFDLVLKRQKLNLIQHGVLPPDLHLPYKISHLDFIYTIDKQSQLTFNSLYNLKSNIQFKLLNSTLNLSKTPYEKSVLIIGQPHSAIREIEIVKELIKNKDNIDMIYIKPHPLYPIDIYRSLDSSSIQIIEDSSYFPEVTVALNYESTLGLEYKASGIPVIDIKGQAKCDIILEVKKSLI